jgi:hypothetical protein
MSGSKFYIFIHFPISQQSGDPGASTIFFRYPSNVEGHYPAYFKVARVTPVFKSKDPTEFSNNQLIKVLPVLSQVYKILLSKLGSYLEGRFQHVRYNRGESSR